MAWIHYQLVYRLKSPLHIGHRKVGNLMQTRPYVPGKVLWGALTARLTRMNGQNIGVNAYEEVGKLLIQNFRFGYLWPSRNPEDGPEFPWDVGEDHFDYLFLHGYASTALDPAGAGAQEGSLHHVEFVAPVARDGKPAYLMGDLWVNEPISDHRIEKWQEALNHLQLGGERSYGWGKVECVKVKVISINHLDGAEVVDSSGDEVILKFKEGSFLPAHALAADWKFDSKNDIRTFKAIPEGKISGPIEPLTGYEYKGKWNLPSPLICYVPGGKITGVLEIKMGDYGILVSPEISVFNGPF